MRSRRLIVLGVLGVLCTVTLAPHVRLYVEQEQHQAQVRADIAARGAAVADLQRQSDLWRDDAFVAAQARQRLHYVFPGETSYVVAPELLAAGSAAAPGGAAVPGDGGAASGEAKGAAGGAVQPWYRELWEGFGEAAEAASVEPPVEPPVEPAAVPAAVESAVVPAGEPVGVPAGESGG